MMTRYFIVTLIDCEKIDIQRFDRVYEQMKKFWEVSLTAVDMYIIRVISDKAWKQMGYHRIDEEGFTQNGTCNLNEKALSRHGDNLLQHEFTHIIDEQLTTTGQRLSRKMREALACYADKMN